MVRLSVCIETIFSELPFIERIKKVSEVGLDAIEFHSWWDKDVEEIKKVSQREKIKVATFCTKFESIVDIKKRESFLKGLAESIQVAKKLDCSQLIAQTGDELPHLSRERQHQQLVEGLKEAADLLESQEITLLVEPINIVTMTRFYRYYLSRSDEAFQILEEVKSSNVKLLYDIAHQQVTEGNLIATIEENIKRIGHFHVRDVPSGHEPGTGEINYKNIIKRINELGYNGFIGLEYRPLAGSKESLDVFKDMQG